jgi:hypothetical protein
MPINEIIEGWRNNLLPKESMKEIIAEAKGYRLNICNNCPKHSKFHNTPLRPDAHCTECGCTLAAKTACLSCKCPLDKWQAYITEQEQNTLNDN